MKKNVRHKKYALMFVHIILFVVFNSCVICTKYRGYVARNCTNDTLLLEITEADTLDDWMYWGVHPGDTCVNELFHDTIEVNIKGEKTVFSVFYCIPPDSIMSDGLYPFPKDSCYIYAIKWQDAIRYTREEIHAKRLYERRVVTKRDFDEDWVYDYKPMP